MAARRSPAFAARARLVGAAAAAGFAVGAIAVAVLAAAGPLPVASRKSFALGALVLGFGVLGWSGSILAGDGYEALQRHLDTGTDWTEATSRRAMARVGGFGAGWMFGASVGTVLLVG